MSIETLATYLECGVSLLAQVERGEREPFGTNEALLQARAVRRLDLNKEAFDLAAAIELDTVPVAGLSDEQVRRVFELVEQLRAQGPDAPPSSGRRRWDP